MTDAVTIEGGTLIAWDSSLRQFRISVTASHDYDANNICTGCGQMRDYQSVSIDDQIALNLLLDLDSRGKTPDDVTITLNGVEYTVENVVKVTEGAYAGRYKFKVVMAPAQIAEEIIVTIDGDAAPLETSVKLYCDQLLIPAFGAEADEKALAQAILNYGQAANDRFADGTTVLAADNADISELSPTDALNASVVFSNTTGLEITGASFMALTKPEFRFYMGGIDVSTAYDYNEAGISATMSGSKPDKNLNARFVKKANGDVLLEVTGVSAENMDKTITVTITGLGTITFNGNAFAKAMASSTNETQQNLGAALYNYGAAAKTCFGA